VNAAQPSDIFLKDWNAYDAAQNGATAISDHEYLSGVARLINEDGAFADVLAPPLHAGIDINNKGAEQRCGRR
jgi:hypothetical protein